MLGYKQFFETRRLDFILDRFDRASDRFDQLKEQDQLGARKYFPNLRYVALRLLAEHEATFNYPVILLKTKSKLKPMDELFNKIFITYPTRVAEMANRLLAPDAALADVVILRTVFMVVKSIGTVIVPIIPLFPAPKEPRKMFNAVPPTLNSTWWSPPPETEQ